MKNKIFLSTFLIMVFFLFSFCSVASAQVEADMMITGSMDVDLGEDKNFSGKNGDDFIANGKMQVSNLPAGFTATGKRVSDKKVTVTFTGRSSNLKGGSIENLTLDFNFEESAFVVTKPVKSDQSGAFVANAIRANNSAVMAFVALSAAQLLSSVSSLSQFNGALYNLFILPFYKRKKKEGITYDADTGQPIPLVEVAVTDLEGRTKEAKTTDKFGSYFFLVAEGEYGLRVNKTGYRLLTKEELESLKTSYASTYTQDKTLSFDQNGGMINTAIPLRKISGTGGVRGFFQSSYFSTLMEVLFYVGFGWSILCIYWQPNSVNIAVAIIYLFFFLLRVANFAKSRWGMIHHQQAPEPFAFINVFNKADNSLQARAIADEAGKYAFILDKGDYKIETRSASSSDVTYEELQVKKRDIMGKKIEI